MPISKEELKLVADSIRTLSMDAIEKAKSGHPGMPLGAADLAAYLWCNVLKYNSADPDWKNRDRFILSAGHASAMLYSLMHFAGYDISLDDMKQFRQYGSKTPGHPEFRKVLGVETTTGPLGQGFANAVGMALARDLVAEEFNTDDQKLIDHFVYVLTSDGDLMEGISYEAASTAGHLGLGKLIYIYDSNKICIDGSTDLAFTDDIRMRFESVNWHVQEIDGHDFEEIGNAISNAQQNLNQPSLIIANTQIGKGSPNKGGTSACHGAPLGEAEVKIVKEALGWDPEKKFYVPERVYDIFKEKQAEILPEYNAWQDLFKNLSADAKAKWNVFYNKVDIAALREKMPDFVGREPIATRSTNCECLKTIYAELPNFVGGSADLGDSNKVYIDGISESGKGQIGKKIHYGIREHAMGALVNGMAYYGGLIPFGATFFTFFDYMVPPVRIAALSEIQSIFVYTHDSFFVGEDGPTHQPVEHLASARMMPNVTLIRPADGAETREAWLAALANTTGPTLLIFSRQNLPQLDHSGEADSLNLHKGAYRIYGQKEADVLFLASGSEVPLAIDSAKELAAAGIKVTVISMPSWELFEKMEDSYKEEILPKTVSKRVVIEAGSRFGWERYAGNDALFITKDDFGASAPAEMLAEKFGFSIDNIVAKTKDYLK